MNSQLISSVATSLYGSVHVRSRPESQTLYLDYFVGGKRHKKSTGLADSPANRRRAEGEAKRIEAAKTLGLLPVPSPSSPAPQRSIPTFGTFAQDWLNLNRPQWRPSTQQQMSALVGRYLIPAFCDLALDTIDRRAVLDLRLALATDGPERAALSPKTLNEVLGVAKALFTEAARQHGIANPLIDLPRLKLVRPAIEPFSVTELIRIGRSIDPQYRALIDLWAATGLRTGETLGLRWRHIDLERRTLTIEETWTDHGIDRPKSDAGHREVRLGTIALRVLSLHQPLTPDPDAPVFTTAAGTRIDRHNLAQRTWAPALQRAGIRHRRIYQLRHSYASLCLAAGEGPAFVARQLGHAGLTEVFQTYGRYIPNARRVDGDQVDAALASVLAQS